MCARNAVRNLLNVFQLSVVRKSNLVRSVTAGRQQRRYNMKCLLCGSENVTEESHKYRLCEECMKLMHCYRELNKK
jgi:uncharacterized protein CbrC (UPF0167 family)